jgi:hypothetical protein
MFFDELSVHAHKQFNKEVQIFISLAVLKLLQYNEMVRSSNLSMTLSRYHKVLLRCERF